MWGEGMIALRAWVLKHRLARPPTQTLPVLLSSQPGPGQLQAPAVSWPGFSNQVVPAGLFLWFCHAAAAAGDSLPCYWHSWCQSLPTHQPAPGTCWLCCAFNRAVFVLD